MKAGQSPESNACFGQFNRETKTKAGHQPPRGTQDSLSCQCPSTSMDNRAHLNQMEAINQRSRHCHFSRYSTRPFPLVSNSNQIKKWEPSRKTHPYQLDGASSAFRRSRQLALLMSKAGLWACPGSLSPMASWKCLMHRTQPQRPDIFVGPQLTKQQSMYRSYLPICAIPRHI